MKNVQTGQSEAKVKRAFVTHRRDGTEKINPGGACGGESPISRPFIFTRPVKAYLNLDELRKHKTVTDGYIFPPLQLAPILKATIQLEDVLLLIDEIVETNIGSLIRETVKDYRKFHFPVTINPCLTDSERHERDELLKDHPTVPSVSFNDRYFFRTDAPATNPFIVIKGIDAVIRGRIPATDENEELTLSEALKALPKVFWNFSIMMRETDNFFQAGVPVTQENYDQFFIQAQARSKFYCLYTRTVPLIINLCENLRRLCFDTLIKNHWAEMAASPQKARHWLKQDHAQIYRLAQKYKYIENADFLTNLEQQRNKVAHPDPFTGSELFRNPYKIVDFFWSFLCNHSDPDCLSVYSRYNPVAMNTGVLNHLENAFHVLRSDAMCLIYAKDKCSTQAELRESNKKILAAIKDDPLFSSDSNPIDNHQMRLGVAHGQPKHIKTANIRENTIVRMQQNMLFRGLPD